jgi:hypothetical protein
MNLYFERSENRQFVRRREVVPRHSLFQQEARISSFALAETSSIVIPAQAGIQVFDVARLNG